MCLERDLFFFVSFSFLRASSASASASSASASTRGVEIPSGLGFGLSARAPGGAPLDLVRFVLYCLPIRIHAFGSFEKLNGSTDQTRASFANETTGSKGKDYRRCPR